MCILTMKSMTHAFRAKSVLAARGISAEVVSLDPKLTEKGCAYGIRFSCSDSTAVERTLTAKALPFGVIMGRRGESEK